MTARGSLGLARRLLAPLLVVAAFALAWPARADQASEAQLQFELGSELYKQGRYVEAIERFVASNRLAPNPNVVFNVAQTFAFLKRPSEAFNWYSTYLDFQLPEDKRAQGEAARAALAPEVGVLEVTTEPSGADLYIDRPELGVVGRAPRKIAVEPGKHRILARLRGYHDAEASVEVERGRSVTSQLTLAAIVGQLQATSQPPGARVRLEAEARDLGVTPLAIQLPIGEHRLIIAAPGFVEQTRSVTIREGAQAVLDVRLSREASKVSVLSVKGNVPGAVVLLDGVDVGKAPLSVADITPGTRTVRVDASGWEPWTGRVLLEPGAATRVDFQLIDPRSRPWPGWRYLGYGVGGALLVAGGVTGGLALGANSDFNREPTAAGLDRLHGLNLATDILLGSGLVVTSGTLLIDLLTPTKRSQGRATLSR